ncbi:MAG: hypothetical protein H7Y61_15530 [Rhizobiales bacterium]|nr:hypothetical protein [Rhizobacter sp.]
MLSTPRRPFPLLQSAASSRLTHKRLRRPTPLPSVRGESALSRHLDRLLWLFGGRRAFAR